MLKRSFFNRQNTAITFLGQPENIAQAIAQARTAETEGADGIALEIGRLAPEFRTVEQFRQIIRSAQLPFMFIDYRNDRWFGGDDAARQEGLLAAAEAGAEVIDVMGDLFQPSPFELALAPEAIAGQRTLIEKIHRLGAKVVMSSHLQQARTAAEVLAQLREQAARGADMLKIVTEITTEEELLEAIRTTLLLQRELALPFIQLANGAFGRFHRYLGLKLGVAVEFAVLDYQSGASQPTIRSFRGVAEHLHWDLNNLR